MTKATPEITEENVSIIIKTAMKPEVTQPKEFKPKLLNSKNFNDWYIAILNYTLDKNIYLNQFIVVQDIEKISGVKQLSDSSKLRLSIAFDAALKDIIGLTIDGEALEQVNKYADDEGFMVKGINILKFVMKKFGNLIENNDKVIGSDINEKWLQNVAKELYGN